MNSDSPLVSIIALSHNHERFLRRALDSIIRQSYAHIEVIMVDDASEPVGYTVWYVSNGELLWVEVNGNYYWEDIFDWTTNQRRSIMAHEAGHLQGIGHIPRSYPVPALMYEGRTNDEREIYYFPQSPDILLVNQIYP